MSRLCYRPNYFGKWGRVAKFTHHTGVVFYTIGIFVLLYRPVDHYMILTAAEVR